MVLLLWIIGSIVGALIIIKILTSVYGDNPNQSLWTTIKKCCIRHRK